MVSHSIVSSYTVFYDIIPQITKIIVYIDLQYQSKVWTHFPIQCVQTFDWYSTSTWSLSSFLSFFLTCSRSWKHCWLSWTSIPPSPPHWVHPRWTPPWCRHTRSPESLGEGEALLACLSNKIHYPANVSQNRHSQKLLIKAVCSKSTSGSFDWHLEPGDPETDCCVLLWVRVRPDTLL